MKLKTTKYLIFYVVLLFATIFFWLNFSYLKDFFQEYSKYISFSQLKSEPIVSYNSFDNFSGLELKDLDGSNLKILNKSFVSAKEDFKNNNEYSYKEFFNLGNLYLLESSDNFSKIEGLSINNIHDWEYLESSIDNIKKSISNYYTAIDTSPNQVSKDFILNNLNISKNFLSFLYNYQCNDFFNGMLLKLNDLLLIFPEMFETLKKQYNALEKWSEDKDLKECIKTLQNSSEENASSALQNQRFFSEVEKNLKDVFKYNMKDEVACHQQIPFLKSKYQESITGSLLYFQDFNKKQQDLLTVFEKGKKEDLQFLCENLDDLQDNDNDKQEQNEMQKNFDNLDSLNKEQKVEKPSPEGEEKLENGQNQDSQDETNADFSRRVESLEKQNENLIEQIQRLKTESQYTPIEYIRKLFKEFYGNQNDFIDGQKGNSNGK